VSVLSVICASSHRELRSWPSRIQTSRGAESRRSISRPVGAEAGEEEIFPDPVAAAFADGWRESAVKALEREFAAFVPAGDASARGSVPAVPVGRGTQ
jgi:hypothetical protein